MERKHTYRLFTALVIGLLIGACTKSEVRTKRFIKQGRWQMTQLTIGSDDISMLPKWNITNTPEDKEFVPATWTHADGSECIFKWRFDYYQGSFSFQIDESVEQDDAAKAYVQCENLSGTYEILTDKRKLFEYQSTETNGYPGLTVFIRIEPL